MQTITPKITLGQYFLDLKNHWHLLKIFVIRDLLVRYKVALLGLGWALLRPLMNMAIFVLIFEKIAHLPSEGPSYPLFVLSAMLPWQLISNTMTSSSTCLINHTSLITKIYFPRLLLPVSSVIVNAIDLSIGYLIFFPWVYFSGSTWAHPLLFPFYLLETLILALGLSFWFSSLTVRYRDVAILAPFIAQAGLFLSPIGFQSSLYPEKLKTWMELNPLVGIIDGFRYSLFGGQEPKCLLSILVTLIVFISGFFLFKSVEKRMVDIL